MAENRHDWPRVHSCLYNWCPKKNDECAKCDAICVFIETSQAMEAACRDASVFGATRGGPGT